MGLIDKIKQILGLTKEKEKEQQVEERKDEEEEDEVKERLKSLGYLQ